MNAEPCICRAGSLRSVTFNHGPVISTLSRLRKLTVRATALLQLPFLQAVEPFAVEFGNADPSCTRPIQSGSDEAAQGSGSSLARIVSPAPCFMSTLHHYRTSTAAALTCESSVEMAVHHRSRRHNDRIYFPHCRRRSPRSTEMAFAAEQDESRSVTDKGNYRRSHVSTHNY